MGDVDGDGTVTSTDLNRVPPRLGDALGDASYEVEADLDLDGTIGSSDHNVVLANFSDTLGDGVLSGADNIVGYAGYLYEEATGMYLARHRWYLPELGRWSSRDPIGYAGGDSNLYGYVGGAPLDYTDPTGLKQYECPNGFINCEKGGTIEGLWVHHYSGSRYIGSKFYATDSADQPLADEEIKRRKREQGKEENAGGARGDEFVADGLKMTKAALEAYIIAASMGIPGPEDAAIFGAILAAKGWKLSKAGDRILDACGNAVPVERVREAWAKERKYWTSKNVNGHRVYQRDDLIDPDLVDAMGRTNRERMAEGLAPIGPDGKSINLHHTLQTNDGPIAPK